MLSYKAGIPTGQKCEKCGEGELLERISRHGFFLGCNRYPECDYIKDLSPELPAEADGEAKIEYCDNCGKEMVIKRGRFGVFLACKGYPDCKTTRRLVSGTRIARQPDVPLDEKCPLDDAQLLRRQGRFGDFIGCTNYPKCKYTRPITLGIKCPKCNEGEFVRRGISRGAAPDAFSTAAAAIPIAISPRRTNPSTSRARNAARRSSWRSAPSREISAPA